MKNFKNMVINEFTAVHTAIENVKCEGEEVLRVVKNEKIDMFDENTYARVNGSSFHNGTIEVKLRSRLLPDAPDFVRGFVGIVYRVDENDREFESFYLRPANGRSCSDSVRKKHGCQYFSYPGYTFQYFREHNITKYEAEADIDMDEWITLKAVIRDNVAEFFINHAETPALVVHDMKHGIGEKGAVGVFVDIGTEAFVSDLRIICED